ncbi:MAG: hypothetical protein ACI92E_002565 [Oceanicoccus sp.]|jgi:hypothetical protein
MTNYVLLNNVDHKDLKIINTRSAEYGDSVMFAMTFPFEFRNIQSCYPIFFQKNADTGQLYPIALFGFKDKENLFLNNDGWDASYIPLMIQRNPFLIGFQEAKDAQGVASKQRVVSIDMDNPRINETEGESVFLEHGGRSEFLEKMSDILEAVDNGHTNNKSFVDALLEYELIESFTMEVTLNDGTANQLVGFYTINEENLQNLDGDALGKLNSNGCLQPLFMIVASHSRIKTLINKKNRQTV